MTSLNPHLLAASRRRCVSTIVSHRSARPLGVFCASVLALACSDDKQVQTAPSATSTVTVPTTSNTDPRDLPSSVVSDTEPLFNGKPPEVQVSDASAEPDLSDARLLTCTPSKGPGEVLLIDDFEDGDEVLEEREGRSGIWYQYQEHAGDHQISFDSLSNPRLESTGALHTSGSDHGQWAGVGVVLSSCVYDASTYVGVHFWIRGDSAPVNVALVTPGVIPVSEGGVCTENEEGLCYDAFRSSIEVDEQWREVFLPFTTFEQLGYGPEVERDLTRLESIQFQSDSGAFDFWIDDLSFYIEEVYTPYDASVPTTEPTTTDTTTATATTEPPGSDTATDTSAVATASEPNPSSAPANGGDGGSP